MISHLFRRWRSHNISFIVFHLLISSSCTGCVFCRSNWMHGVIMSSSFVWISFCVLDSVLIFVIMILSSFNSLVVSFLWNYRATFAVWLIVVDCFLWLSWFDWRIHCCIILKSVSHLINFWYISYDYISIRIWTLLNWSYYESKLTFVEEF